MGKDLILQKPSAQLAQKVIIHNEEERFWVADDENGLFQGPSFWSNIQEYVNFLSSIPWCVDTTI